MRRNGTFTIRVHPPARRPRAEEERKLYEILVECVAEKTKRRRPILVS